MHIKIRTKKRVYLFIILTIIFLWTMTKTWRKDSFDWSLNAKRARILAAQFEGEKAPKQLDAILSSTQESLFPWFKPFGLADIYEKKIPNTKGIVITCNDKFADQTLALIMTIRKVQKSMIPIVVYYDQLFPANLARFQKIHQVSVLDLGVSLLSW